MMAYVLDGQRDRYGLAAVTARVARFIRPGNGRTHMAEVFRQMAALEPAGETDFRPAIDHLAGRVRRKSVFVVFSDCYQDPEHLTKAIGALTLQGHDTILYQVYHPAELELPFPGFTLFRDLETGQLDTADAVEIRQAYQAVFAAHRATLKSGSRRFGTEFHSLPVSQDWDLVLAGLLRRRRAQR
jgi:uncharacterized protein (DUF58 family)